MSARNLDRYAAEVHILQSLMHPNVVEFKYFISDYMLPVSVGGNGSMWGAIVMEYCPYDLFDYLKVCHHFNEDVTRTYFGQLLSGLSVCHEMGIYHRDIKPDNLLLDSAFQLK